MHAFSLPVEYLTHQVLTYFSLKEKQINLWWCLEVANESNAQPEDVRKKAEQLWVYMSTSVKKTGEG